RKRCLFGKRRLITTIVHGLTPTLKHTLMLFDNHGRRMNYLRLSVTDNCNLRCHYCMPNELMHFARTSDLMTWEEMLKLTQVFVKLGVDKIRITGGEPF